MWIHWKDKLLQNSSGEKNALTATILRRVLFYDLKL